MGLICRATSQLSMWVKWVAKIMSSKKNPLLIHANFTDRIFHFSWISFENGFRQFILKFL